MAFNKRKSILIVPPKGARIRFFQVRVSLIVFVLLFFIAGFAGYFIPFNNLSLDVVEQNQKKNISEQNRELLFKIHGMRKALQVLTNKISMLNSRKRKLESVIGSLPSDSKTSVNKDSFSKLSLDDLLAYAVNSEKLYRELAVNIDKNPKLLYSIPVLYPIEKNKNVAITAGFGKMLDPFTGDTKWHYGVDFSAPKGTNVLASADGVVTSVSKDKKWGHKIVIKHSKGFSTVYAHLGRIKTAVGKHVKHGDVIATVGVSGLTTGPHLHYEVHIKNKKVDPMDYIFPDISDTLAKIKNRISLR